MIGFRSRFLLVIAATVGLAATAWAEGIFPVNDAGTGTWVFDQPSVVANGSILHVAFVGDSAAGADTARPTPGSITRRSTGRADFTNKATTRSQVLVTAPVAIDNGDAYTGARHPQIALRTATELVILFQAIPVGDDGLQALPRRADDRKQRRDVPARERDPGRGGRKNPGEPDRPLLRPRDHRQHPAGRLFLVPVPGGRFAVLGRVLRACRAGYRPGGQQHDPPDDERQQRRRIAPPASPARRPQVQPRRLGGQQFHGQPLRESITRWCTRSHPASWTTLRSAPPRSSRAETAGDSPACS